MEYIKFDENQNVLHFGRCKVTSNAVIKQIIVEPKNEELKVFFSSFDQQIFQQKNIISVLTEEGKIIDLILIFKNDQICVTVFKHIYKNRTLLTIEQLINAKSFNQEHLLPLMKSIKANELLKEKLAKTAEKILKFCSTSDAPMTNTNEIYSVKENTSKKNINLKRKHHHHTPTITRNFIVKQFTKNGISKNRLIVFVNSERIKCYEYHWLKSNNYYVCSGCDTHRQRRTVTAKIIEKRNEKFVKLSEKPHICEPRNYDPEKCNTDLIVGKTGYEKVEASENGFMKKRIIVFIQEDKKYCYEFSENTKSKAYYCVKCMRKKCHILAKVRVNNKGEEYLSITNKKHICEPIEYQPGNYETQKIVVKKPFFDFVKRRVHGKIVEKLVIFDEKDPSMCYEYKIHINNYFSCYNCFKKEKNYCVSAKLYKDEKNGDYLELKQKQHICGLRKFVPEELDSNIVYSDGFMTDEYRAADGLIKKRLIVYDRQDRSLCHIYHNVGNRGRDYWLCSGCLKLRLSKSLKFNQNDPQKPYIELSVKPHICQLQPYIPSKIEPLKPPKIIKKHDYIIEDYLMPHGKKMGKRLMVFVANDRKLCYTYNLSSHGYFVCFPCGGTTAYVIAKLCKDEKSNEEYIKLNDREHTCQPQPYIPDNNRDTIQIIKKPNFTFRSDPDDEKIKILIIFDPSNKELCYKYTYRPAKKQYVCKKCRLLHKRMAAKVIKDENGEECIQLNSDQHLCELEPVDPKIEPPLPDYERKKLCAAEGMLRRNHNRNLNYCKLEDVEDDENQPELQILHASNYKVKTYHENGVQKSRLWIFPLKNDSTKCYEYFWSNYYECFLCCACEAMKPKNLATAIILKQNHHQAEYVELGQNQHKCEIRNFNPQSFEEKYCDRKIVKKPGWKLGKNKNGDDQLVIFDESNQSLCYVYAPKKNCKSTYFCNKCYNKKNGVYVTAKLFNSNTEGEYVELGRHQHECKPQKCLPAYLR